MLHSASTSKKICQTTCVVKVKAASLPDAVQEADPMAILEQLMKKGQQKPEKTPKNEKTSKQLLGEFYGDKKHLESLLKDKGTVSLGFRPCDLCADCDSGSPRPTERVPSSPSSRSDTGDDEKWGAIEGCHPGLPPKSQHVHRALGPGETHWLVRERDQEQGGEK